MYPESSLNGLRAYEAQPILDAEIATRNYLPRGLCSNLLMLGNLRSMYAGSSQVPQMRQSVYDAAPKGSIGHRPNTPARNRARRKGR